MLINEVLDSKSIALSATENASNQIPYLGLQWFPERKKQGLNPANCCWFWGAGTRPSLTSFEEKTNKKGAMISAVDLLKGIAVGSSMKVITVEGANGGLHTNYAGKAQAAIDILTKDNYDFVLIDCPPSLGLLTTNALVASDSVIIPVQCEFFALEGITQLLNTIIMTQTRLNPTLKIEGVLLTLLDSRTNLGLEVVEEVRKFFKDKVFNTIIPRLIRLVEAPSHGEPINEYDPTSRAAEAYSNLAKEVIERDGK